MEGVWCEVIPRGGGERFLCTVFWGPIGQRALGQLCSGAIRSQSTPEATKHSKTLKPEGLKTPAERRKQQLHEEPKKVGGKKRNCVRKPGRMPP